MAIKKKGSSLNGKLGNTVTYLLNGQEVTRGIGITKKTPTQSQLIARKKLSIIAKSFDPFLGFIALGFGLQAKKTTKNYHNVAVAVNCRIENLVIGEYPNLGVDYSKLIVSQGKIPVNDQIKVENVPTGLNFTWDTTPALLAGMKANDHVMLIAYCPEKRKAFFVLDGAYRRMGTEKITIPRYDKKITVHTFAAFIASDRKSISDSVFTGTLLW